MDRLERRQMMVAVCALVVGLTAAGQGAVIYVDDDAGGANDGSSWIDAFAYLQDALATAQAGDEIRVAQGVYRPDQSSVHPAGTSDRNASFRLLDGVAIKGGFAGVGETDPNARDMGWFESILSGDLAGDDMPVVDVCDLLIEPTRAENAYHIVTAEPCGRSAILDGFTIRSGVDGSLRLLETSKPCRPSIRNCIFAGNAGPAAMVHAATRPEFIGCTFLRNASLGGGAAMFLSSGRGATAPDELVVKGCTFAWNCAVGLDEYAVPGRGGAVLIWQGSPSIIEDCTFLCNRADLGGAIYSERNENIVNCRFIANVANEAGGAVCFEGTEMCMRSCTLLANVAPCAGACYAGDQAVLSITDSILWDGGDEIGIGGEQASAVVVYSDVQGGWPGQGNIDADPLFAAPGYWDPNGTPDDPNDDVWIEGNYHLKSQAGRWDPAAASWVLDDVTSPCIDAGDPTSPIGAEPEPNGGTINMGAYGGTTEASKSPVGQPDAVGKL